MRTIDLSFSRDSERYTISIGRELLKSLPRLILESCRAKRVILLADSHVLSLHGGTLEQAFKGSGITPFISGFHASEPAKSLETVSSLYHLLLSQRVERGTPIVAVGGGITGDVVGFVAATYLRGVPFFQVPTTLLAMVDASVGGKVGVNLPHGKNLVGAFYQPRAVVVDPETLTTLSEREYRAGLAECVKHAIIKDETLFDWTEQNAEAIMRRDIATLEELIFRNVSVKAAVVMADEKEAGERALLNLGHTFAHAIEARTNYSIFLHGEAVSLGIAAAARLAALVFGSPAIVQNKINSLLTKLGLPVTAKIPPSAELLKAMYLDKKVEDAEIRLVLPTGIGSAEIKKGIAENDILSAWESIRAA